MPINGNKRVIVSFWKLLLASIAGFIIASFLVIIIIFWVVSGALSDVGKKKKEEIAANSILKISLDKEIEDRVADNPFDDLLPSGLGTTGKMSLIKLLSAIKHAATDQNIKGIYLNLTGVGGGMASLEAIREALVTFKKSGKFIYSYSEMMSEKAYYLATVADKIFLYPTGYLEWNGLMAQLTFFRGALDKLEIEPRLFKVGSFKSAAESFVNTEMSEANRTQYRVMLTDFWDHLLEKISAARDIPIADLRRFADSLTVTSARTAKIYNMIDDLAYEDQVLNLLKEKSGIESKEKIRFVSLAEYFKHLPEPLAKENRIAVVYAEGSIFSGEGDEESIGSETMVKALRKAREDEKIKAVVLRVNSPGGSALASDVIAREIRLIREAGKPIIASMGDVAASGGYYISAQCNKIIAQANTITGSIGVIGLLFGWKKLCNKYGITFDGVNTNTYADAGNPNRDMSDFEKRKIQNSVNEIYSDFVKIVQTGRGFADSAAVDAIGQGRVWTGKQALKINLVDKIGGLSDAIALAAETANLKAEDYSIIELPKVKSAVEKLIENLSESTRYQLIRTLVPFLHPEQLRAFQVISRFNDPNGVYMQLIPMPIIN